LRDESGKYFTIWFQIVEGKEKTGREIKRNLLGNPKFPAGWAISGSRLWKIPQKTIPPHWGRKKNDVPAMQITVSDFS
jgi:hypothetical protein